MTKELLEQYPDICAEIKELEQRMREPVTDTVSGSSEDYPYTQHPVSIKGIVPTLAEQLDRLRKQKADIEAFVAKLPTSGQRRVVTLRAFRGLSWPNVSAKMGHRYSIDRTKRMYYSSLEKYF